VNRGVLHAVKAWDAFVFKAPPAAARAHEAKAAANLYGQAAAVVAAAAAAAGEAVDEFGEQAEGHRDKRPRIKVAGKKDGGGWRRRRCLVLSFLCFPSFSFLSTKTHPCFLAGDSAVWGRRHGEDDARARGG
jgi:hypothetical protein